MVGVRAVRLLWWSLESEKGSTWNLEIEDTCPLALSTSVRSIGVIHCKDE
jgi:hypothetical protein